MAQKQHEDAYGIELFRRISQGDESSLAEAISLYGADVLRVCRAITKDWAYADAAANEAWADAACKKRVPESNPTGWIRTIARHKSRKLIKKCSSGRIRFQPLPEGQDFGDNDVEKQVMVRELGRALLAAIAELPPHQQTAFMQHEMENLSCPEIAKRMGRNENTVNSDLRKARIRLRETLTRWGYNLFVLALFAEDAAAAPLLHCDSSTMAHRCHVLTGVVAVFQSLGGLAQSAFAAVVGAVKGPLLPLASVGKTGWAVVGFLVFFLACVAESVANPNSEEARAASKVPIRVNVQWQSKRSSDILIAPCLGQSFFPTSSGTDAEAASHGFTFYVGGDDNDGKPRLPFGGRTVGIILIRLCSQLALTVPE